MKSKKRNISIKGLLRLIGDVGETYLFLDRKQAAHLSMYPKIFDLEDYFPSVLIRATDKLERRGLVRRIQTKDGTVIQITDKGKTATLKFRLEEFKPKTGKWDGKWRIVFFDIPNLKNSKRNWLRKYLTQLGLKRLQESVFIGPFDVTTEVAYLREILDVPHGVKMGVLEKIENEDELKEIFDL